jgi:hypothetical protein
MFALLPAALSFRFAWAGGAEGTTGVEAVSTVGASCAMGVPWRTSIAPVNLSLSVTSNARIWSVVINERLPRFGWDRYENKSKMPRRLVAFPVVACFSSH